MTGPITDIVFDFCGVLVDWQCRAALEGRYPDDLVERICADDDPLGFFRYEDDMDGGALLADVLPVVAAEQGDGIADIFRDYIERYGDALPRLVPGMENLLADLDGAGYRLWGLTNWSCETFHFAFEKFPQLERYLGGTVVSGVEKKRKPNADIYRLAEERFSLDPAATVFLDDTAKNVDGAIAAGWHGLKFTDADQARRNLAELGVRI
ncbi:HAD family phosphatase [Bifidobacterium sp. BRDM6]|uniref:HAD family phosphatase n=2 Tax=Bifidobacterium choloepi TaxID=2614131 RepID=A0A6I5N0I0_9BIFI|nr:HAD family phosphatase [Bifidobacterium choloepi]NEG69159.1 HAD family phosphatase [Bifidobacterium choloepi]